MSASQNDWLVSVTRFLRYIAAGIIACVILAGSFIDSGAYTEAEKKLFNRSIVDRQRYLNPKFRKKNRKSTRYIIVHTSEGGLNSTLRSVSKGKKMRNGRYTHGGHTHYVIARSGRTYRVLNKRYRADHAGRSMWNGQTDLSSVSIGIEIVGYHYAPITAKQYRSLDLLISILQRIYDLHDTAVLTHSQVAYGRPNRWIKASHRGRKRCAKNFIRSEAGLGPTWSYDPDVKAGRLRADPELASLYYGRRRATTQSSGSNVIAKNQTAWTIAGEEYDSPRTLYQLPNGKVIPGDQIGKRVGWNRIPENTIVLLNQEKTRQSKENQLPVKMISNGYSAWDIAGLEFNKGTTFYFFPRGRVKNGKEISDWDGLPKKTRMIIGYRGPYELVPGRPAIKIAGEKYNKKETLYYFPNKKIVSGDAIRNFKRLPKGVMIFLPAKG